MPQQGPTPPDRSFYKEYPLHSSLYDAEQLARIPSLSTAQLIDELSNRALTLLPDRRIHVELIGPEGQPPVSRLTIESVGGMIDNVWRHRVDAWVPVDRLIELAMSLPEGYRVEPAAIPCLEDVMGEGPAVIGSDSHRNGGADGTQIGVAIIDEGYNNFSEAQANGDAPPNSNLTIVNLTEEQFESGTRHGTGCVEALYDHAPGATYRLYRLDSLTDLGVAVEDALDHGTDIFSHSISWFNTGWDDDSGDACGAASAAGDDGALFFTAAGNRADSHWQGEMRDSDIDGWHEWLGTDEGLTVEVPDSATVSFHLSWDTSGGIYDYDLWLYDETMIIPLAFSMFPGNIYESVTWTNLTGSDVLVNLLVQRDLIYGFTEIEVFSAGPCTWLEHIVSQGSTTSPSNCTDPGVVSVGAVDWVLYPLGNGASGIIKDYSGRGPSNSGMSLPDLCGPTDTSGFTYWSFGGTSCATPNVAGAAAAFWSGSDLLRDDGIRWLMNEHARTFKDWGINDIDNTYGWGGANLLDYVPQTVWVGRSFGNFGDDPTLPFYTIQAAHDAATPGGRILIFLGGDYPEPVTLTTMLEVETVVNPAILGQ
jgi:hypothetical protein